MGKVIIRGRSIDGTVYLDMSFNEHGPLWGWVSDAREATRMEVDEAEEVLPHVRNYSRSKSPDDIVGHVCIITAPPELSLLRRWWGDVIEYANEGEYVIDTYGSLMKDDHEPGPQPTYVGLVLMGAFSSTFGRLLWMFKSWQCRQFGHGKHWVDESYGGPDNGADGGYCSRCGFSFHHTYY